MFFFSSRRRHTRWTGDWSSDVCSSDLATEKQYTELPRPAVVAHPVTGRPILFVNPMHVHGFVGMERREAWDLIEELAAHRSEERRVGNECGSGWSAELYRRRRLCEGTV